MVEVMSVATLRARVEAGTAPQIVDVRRARAYREAHVPGAVNLPLPELPERVAEVDWDEAIVCVCPKGESSLRAARLLEAYESVPDEATVYSLDEGLQAWDGPVDSGAARTAEPPAADRTDTDPDAPF